MMLVINEREEKKDLSGVMRELAATGVKFEMENMRSLYFDHELCRD